MSTAILFDFGGTLDTDGVHWSEMLWEICERVKVPVQKRDFEAAFVKTETLLKSSVTEDDGLTHTFFKKISAQFDYYVEHDWIKQKNAPKYVNEIVRQCVDTSYRGFEKSKKVLEALKPNYKLGVVSNYYGNLKTVLAESGLARLMDVWVDSSVVKVFKPDPKIFRIALDALSIAPSDAYVVGDSYTNDIAPGKQIGCRTIWLDVKSWTRPDKVDAADYTVNSLEEIVSVLC